MTRKCLGIWMILLFLVTPLPALAGDLSLSYDIVQSDSTGGEMVHGTLELVVYNNTSGDLNNMNVSLENPEPGTIENDVFQLGTVKAGWGGVHSGSFAFTQEALDSANPIRWLVDYDDATGTHHQVILTIND